MPYTTHRIINSGSYQISGIFDEITLAGQNTIKQTSTGSTQVSGEFDEVNLPRSVYFNGTSDYLNIPSNYTMTGDFTAEAFVYNTGSNDPCILGTLDAANSQILRILGGFQVVYFAATYTGTIPVPKNQWVHLAVSRQGTTVRLFTNGILSTTAISGVPVIFKTIGALAASTDMLQGNISNLRVVNGSALYTSNFTPPTRALSTTSGTVLLLSSTAISPYTDLSTSSYTLTRAGSPVYNSRSPFAVMRQVNTGSLQVTGGLDEVSWNGSVYFNGTSYLSVPYTSAFDFGSGDFTIELWMNATSINTVGIMAVPHNASNYAPVLFVGGSATGLQLYSSSNGTSWDVASGVSIGTIVANAWNHVAVSKSSSSIRLFLNGVLGNTVPFAGAFSGTYDRVWIGDTTGNSTYTGYLSNIRIVKGTALYTAAFTPSNSPLTVVPGTSLLMRTGEFEPFGDDSTNNFSITRIGAPVFNSKSPFVPGS